MNDIYEVLVSIQCYLKQHIEMKKLMYNCLNETNYPCVI